MSSEEVAALRLALFAGVFAILAGWEFLLPVRAHARRVSRWPSNLGLSVLNTVIIRLLNVLFPVTAILAAATLEDSGLLAWGGIDGMMRLVAGFVLLDLAIYAQHRMFHGVPLFWSLHRVHHADLTLDVSSALRFHPLEILVSQAWKLAVVVVVGVPAVAAIAFEVILNASAMFSHANVRLPVVIERMCRIVIVTPGMHRIHHSTDGREMNSNYGFNFSVWDRLFGSYVGASKQPEDTMEMGLPHYRTEVTARAGWLLVFPFLRGPVA